MTRTLLTLAFVTVVVSLCAPAHAGPPSPQSPRVTVPRQGTPLPPRDTSARRPGAPTPTGTGRLSGRVTAADSGLPLARVVVTATAARDTFPRRGENFVPGRGLSARTDDQGRFTIGEVPEGEYTLTARRSGYVDQMFGQRARHAPGRPVAVGDGASVSALDFSLRRGGVIAGRVLDDTGEPAERVTVRAMEYRRVAGQWRAIGAGMTDQTDDLGQYRLFGLHPGEYVIVAEPEGRRMGRRTRQVQGVDVDTVATYGPSSVGPAEATRVQVEPGSEASMDVQLIAARVAAVRGRVVDSKGMPLESGMAVLLTPDMSIGIGGQAPIRAGRFEIDAVPPGSYVLRVDVFQRGDRADASPPPEGATQLVAIEGEDVDVTVQTTPGSIVRGRLVVEGDASALAGRELGVMGVPSGEMAFSVARGRVRSDRTFEVAGLRGAQLLSLQGLPQGWWVKDLLVGGQSAIDGFDWGQNRLFTGAELIVSSAPSGLSGRASTPSGAPAADYAVVLFPDDPSRWESTSGRLSAVQMARPGLDGTFSLPAVRPGTYYAVAVAPEQADASWLLDADHLRDLAGRARTVEVKAGQLTPVTLTLVER